MPDSGAPSETLKWVDAYTLSYDGLLIRGPDGKAVANFAPATLPGGQLYPSPGEQRQHASTWCARLNLAYNQGKIAGIETAQAIYAAAPPSLAAVEGR